MKRLGFALIPKDTEYFYSLSEKLASELLLSFSLKREATIPHVSLFQGIFPNEKKIIELFSDLPLDNRLVNQTITGGSIWAEKIIFLDLKRSPELQSTHDYIFNLVFKHATGKSADPQIFTGISTRQQSSFNETGYPFSLTAYHPHMTIGHLVAPQDINQYLTTNITQTLVTFDKIIVFVVGDKGVCTEILYERMI